MADRFLPLAEDWKPGMRLGRHIRHDPRSLAYLVQPTGVAQTKIWQRHIDILDQGNLGSCTGNATVGALGTEGLYEHLTADQQATLTEDEAVKLYSLATQIDDYPGDYPPDDTGSTGLDVAKAAQQSGYLSGYRHITSVSAAQTAIVTGPFIVGSNWYSGMDDPATDGVVHVKGTIRGGHEYCCFGYDATVDRWWFANSWGTSWGLNGTFAYSGGDFAKLLAQQGDATVLVPASQPAPQPTPPQPPAVSVPPADVDAWAARVSSQAWQSHRDRAAAADYLTWRTGVS